MGNGTHGAKGRPHKSKETTHNSRQTSFITPLFATLERNQIQNWSHRLGNRVAVPWSTYIQWVSQKRVPSVTVRSQNRTGSASTATPFFSQSHHMGQGHWTHFIYNIKKQLHISVGHKASFGCCPSSQAKKHRFGEWISRVKGRELDSLTVLTEISSFYRVHKCFLSLPFQSEKGDIFSETSRILTRDDGHYPKYRSRVIK